MRNFLFGNLFLACILFFSSCKKDYYASLVGQEQKVMVSDLQKPIPADTTCIYKTGVDAYGQYLSGLLIIKSLKEDNYRLVFTTEMGLKLFDFEFKDEEFVVHYCMEKLNKKPVLNLLEKDFSLMLAREVLGDKEVKKVQNQDKIEYHWKAENEIRTYYTFQSGRTYAVIARSPKGNVKVSIDYQSGALIPENVKLVHKNLNLKMKLKLLK